MNPKFQSREWRENRILRKANKNRLFELRCVHFSDLPDADQASIHASFSFAGKPILVFFHDKQKWTVVTTDEVVSFHDHDVNFLPLGGMSNEIRYGVDDHGGETSKHTANYLRVGKSGMRFWAPEGDELHTLWGILKMFSQQDECS